MNRTLAETFHFSAAGQADSVKPRPLYRSLTFWSGILVMIFLSSAWVDSNHFGINLRRHVLGTQYIVVHGQNRVLLITATGPVVNSQNEMRRSPTKAARNFAEAFPPFRFRAVEARAPSTGFVESKGHLVNFPHWLLLLAVALPWSGLLLWRARRIRRGSLAVVADG